jgi:replicative DNA helicase
LIVINYLNELNMPPFKLFVSYSHADELSLTELEKHLSTLKRENLLATWHDRKIVPGSDWEGKIDEALQDSDIIVFLISPDFIASEYCIEKEVAVALEKHNRGDVIVIPIVVRPVDWLSTPIAKIQALPKDANPISAWSDKDQAWLEVAKGIRTAIGVLEKRRTPSLKQPLFCGISQALTTEIERLEQRYMSDSSFGGVPTGLHDLDTLLDGLHAGDLIYVAATPVMDRMALLVSIMSHICVEKSLPGIIFSLKQSKEQIARRLCSALGKIPVRALLRGELEENDWGRLTYALGTINDKAIGIVDQSHLDINTITSQIDQFMDQHGSCALVVIDHFEHVTGGSRPELLTILGRYARTNKIPIIVACGFERDPSSRPNKRPVLRDIGEWGVLNEDIDVVIFIYQDEQYDLDSPDKGIAEVIVEKNSRGPVGTVITTYLREEQVLINYAKLSA